LDNDLEQPTLLASGLLQEQLARPACQAQHVDDLINGGRCGLLDILDFALQRILLPAPSGRMFVEKVGKNQF
jgi:hypothetical protein